MYYFQVRYYGSTLARFLSIDPGNIGASVDDPQSWNAYAYALNNPLVFIDPTGLASESAGPTQNTGPIQLCERDSANKCAPPKAAWNHETARFLATLASYFRVPIPPPPPPAPPVPNGLPGATPERDSRTDVGMVPAGSGKPEPFSIGPAPGWRLDWKVMEIHGENLSFAPPKFKIELFEKLKGEKYFKPGGSVREQINFTDIFTREKRSLIQFYKVDGKQVQFVLGRNSAGKLTKSWYIRVKISPKKLTYEPSSGQ